MNSGQAHAGTDAALKGNEEALATVTRHGAQETALSEQSKGHSRLHSEHLL